MDLSLEILYISPMSLRPYSPVVYTLVLIIFNIGSGTGTSLRDLVGLIQDLIDTELVISYKPSRSFDVPTNVLSINKAVQELCWKPSITPKLGLQKYYDALMASHRFNSGM